MRVFSRSKFGRFVVRRFDCYFGMSFGRFFSFGRGSFGLFVALRRCLVVLGRVGVYVFFFLFVVVVSEVSIFL